MVEVEIMQNLLGPASAHLARQLENRTAASMCAAICLPSGSCRRDCRRHRRSNLAWGDIPSRPLLLKLRSTVSLLAAKAGIAVVTNPKTTVNARSRVSGLLFRMMLPPQRGGIPDCRPYLQKAVPIVAPSWRYATVRKGFDPRRPGKHIVGGWRRNP